MRFAAVVSWFTARCESMNVATSPSLLLSATSRMPLCCSSPTRSSSWRVTTERFSMALSLCHSLCDCRCAKMECMLASIFSDMLFVIFSRCSNRNSLRGFFITHTDDGNT